MPTSPSPKNSRGINFRSVARQNAETEDVGVAKSRRQTFREALLLFCAEGIFASDSFLSVIFGWPGGVRLGRVIWVTNC